MKKRSQGMTENYYNKIDSYLCISHYNIFIYKQLTEQQLFKGLFEPVYFFDTLYSFFDIINENIKQTETLRIKLNVLFEKEKFTENQIVYFYGNLCNLLVSNYGSRFNETSESFLFQRNVFINLVTEYIKYKVDFRHTNKITIEFAKYTHSFAELLARFDDIPFTRDNELNLKSEEVLNNVISWENQTELSELIYVLFHSKKVLKNGKPIQQKDLTELLNKTFNTNIKEPTDLLKKSMTSNKVVYDGKTFISELNSILEVYKKKTLDKDSK